MVMRNASPFSGGYSGKVRENMMGSPASAGDIGEDDGMELHNNDAFSSVVDSAEKRDKVGSMVFDVHDKSV